MKRTRYETDSMDYAESWGAYLADFARLIAAGHISTSRADGDLFAGICDGFLREIANCSAEGRPMGPWRSRRRT
jgi:hypothetical protein